MDNYTRKPRTFLAAILLLAVVCAVLVSPANAQGANLDVALTVNNPLAAVARSSEPVTSGLPIPQGMNLTNLSALRLLDANGQPVPAQFTPLARWGGPPDDTAQPIRWLLLDFQADVAANSTTSYRLVNSGGAEAAFPVLDLTDSAEAITIDTGAAQFSINKTDGSLNASGLARPLTGNAIDTAGASYSTTGPVTVTVTLSGPMRVSVEVRGAYRDAGGVALLDYTSRYWFYAGQPTVRLFHTVENNTPCPLDDYGQINCHYIGSEGSIDLADLSLALSTGLSGNVVYEMGGEIAAISGELTDKLILYQDSSGMEHWDHYLNLADWDGNRLDTRPRMQAYVTFRGYQTTLGEALIDSGNHAIGWLSISGNNGAWSVGVRDFWQNFPKALRATPDGTLEIGLFPGEFGPDDYSFNLRAGEYKTHEVWLSQSAYLPSFSSSLFAQASSEWYVDSGAFGLTALPEAAGWPEHEAYVNYQLDTAPNFRLEDMNWFPNLYAAIESADFYGIFDYGDWPIDYEGFGVASFNFKYDSDYGAWLQWARGGDPRWFALAEAADRHFADIDILHTLHEPRHWSDGLAFGHSYHDEPGFTNPHRNEGGIHPDIAYGMDGMLLTYYLTGYEKAYESALELADCIEYRLHNEWLLCDFFPEGTCSGEGYGLHSSEGLYEAGGRPAANGLSIVVQAYRATADPRYLDVADALVDWARAADQPYINGPTGEELMMRPWMLNMYLRALSRYLEMRVEFGLPDSYDAAGSYIGFADWLRTYAIIDLDPVDTGPRAAYPYEWWFDDRQGDVNDEWAIGNNIPSINNWVYLGADAMAYAYHLSGDSAYLELAASLFRTGSRDPFFEGDENTYTAAKEMTNGIVFGNIFLYEWANR